MITLRTIDTRVFIAAALAIVIAAQGYATWVGVRTDTARQQQRVTRDLQHTLDLVTPTLAAAMQAGDIESVQATLRVLAATPALDFAAIVAPDARIVAASDAALIGLPAERLTWLSAASLRAHSAAAIADGADGIVVALQPLAAGAGAGVDGATPGPLVVLMHDGGKARADLHTAAWHAALVNIGMAVLVALVVSFCYSHYIAKPTRRLAGLVRDLGATGSATPIAVRGVGDLTDLGSAFARAGERMAERQSALTHLNAELAARQEYLETTLRAQLVLRDALENSERRLRAAIDSGEVGVWEWDAATDDFAHFGNWIDQFSELASSGLIMGADHMRITHPDDREPVLAALRAHLTGASETYQVEQRLLMRDGKYRNFLIRGNTTTRDDDGQPRKLTGTYTDVTELREQQQRLELALEYGREGLFEWWPGSDELRVSDNWVALFGNASNRLRTAGQDFVSLMHPADVAPTRAAAVRALKGEQPFEAEFRVRRNDGDEMWVLARGVVVERDVNGRALRLLGTHVDVTALKLVQDRLQLALDSVPQGIIEWWPDDDRLLPSASWLRLTGHAAQDIRSPTQLIESQLLHPDDAAAVEKLLLEFSSGLIVSGKLEFRFRFATGEYHWILASGQVAEYDAEGRSRRIVGTFIDISELKVAEQRLEVAVEAARQGIWEWLPEHDRFIASRSWTRLFGYAPGEIPDQMHPLVKLLVHADDFDGVWRALDGVRNQRLQEFTIEFRQKTQSGEYLWVMTHGVVVERDQAGNALRVIGSDIDISHLR